MSRQFSIALSIWARSALLNGFISPFIAGVEEGPAVVLVALIIIALGFVITAPLLAIITPIVKLSVKMPYGPFASRAGLAFFMVVLAFLFMKLFVWVFTLSLADRFWSGLLVGSLTAVLLASLSVGRSFNRYKQETDATDVIS